MNIQEYKAILQLQRNCDITLIQQLHQNANDAGYQSRDVPAAAYHSLLHGNWLNDEIMYAYSKLLQLQAYCLNSHFYELLVNKKYDNAIKWMKQITNPKFKHIICFPVNINNVHWVAVGVNLLAQCIVFSDSMGGLNSEIVSNTLGFMTDKQREIQAMTGYNYKTQKFSIFSRDSVQNENHLKLSVKLQQFVGFSVSVLDFNTVYINKMKARAELHCFEQFSQLVTVEDNQLPFDQQLQYYYFAANMPRQTNCDDCGVYSLMFLKYFCMVCSDCANGLIKSEMRYMIANELQKGALQYWDV